MHLPPSSSLPNPPTTTLLSLLSPFIIRCRSCLSIEQGGMDMDMDMGMDMGIVAGREGG